MRLKKLDCYFEQVEREGAKPQWAGADGGEACLWSIFILKILWQLREQRSAVAGKRSFRQALRAKVAARSEDTALPRLQSLLAALRTRPAVRTAQLFFDAVKHCGESAVSFEDAPSQSSFARRWGSYQ